MKYLWLILLGFYAHSIYSNEYPTTVENKEPLLNTVKGEPIKLEWPDGRVGQLYSVESEIESLDLQISLNKSTCSQIKTPPKCYLKTNVKLLSTFYYWLKNPINKSAVDKMIRIVPSDNEERYQDENRSENLTQNMFLTPYFSFLAQSQGLKASEEIPKDVFVCDDYSWLPGNKKGTFETVEFPVWLTEFEFNVDEFDFGEKISENINQYSHSSKNVTLKKTTEGYRVDNVQQFNGNQVVFPLMTLGYHSDLYFHRKQFANHPLGFQEEIDPQCKVEFTLNFTQLFEFYNKLNTKYYTEKKYNFKNKKPFIYDEKNPLIYFFRDMILNVYDFGDVE